MPLGRNFLEVVTTQDNTAAGGYLSDAMAMAAIW